MKRVIPKNTKIVTTLWKSYTIIDFAIAAVILAIVLVAASSNLEGKWFVAGAFLIIGFFLLVDWGGDEKGYMFFASIIKYLASPKLLKKGAAKNSIDDVLPYVDIEEGAYIKYRAGYYAKVIEIGQIEFGLLSESSQDSRISAFEKVLCLLDDSQRAELVKIDRPLNFDDWAYDVYEQLEETDNEVKKAILESRLFDVDVINNIEKIYTNSFYFVFYANDKARLDDLCVEAVDILQSNKMSAALLDEKQTAVFLKYCHTRNFDEREIDDIELADYLDWVKPQEISFKKFGSRRYSIKTSELSQSIYASCFAIKDYPILVDNAWGASLFNIDNTKVVLKFKPVSGMEATKRLDKAFREIASQEKMKASEQLEQSTHLDTLSETLEAIKNGNEKLFDCSTLLTVFGNDCDEKDRKNNFSSFKKRVRHEITGLGFKVSDLLFKQIEGVIAQNITKNNLLKRFDRGINSSSAAAVFPFVNTSMLDEGGFLLGWNLYPVFLNPFKRDGENYTNSNCVIVGRPGSGKSFCTKTLLTNLYSGNCRFFVLDVENEYSKLARSLNGTIIDVGNGGEGRINPFHIYPILTEDGSQAPPEEIFSSKLRTLESFFRIILKGIDNDTFELINNLVGECYKKRGISETTDCTKLKASDFPTFDDLFEVIKTKKQTAKNSSMLVNYERAEAYIEKFAHGGRYSNLWNGPSTLEVKTDFVVFNFQSLLSGKNNVVANAQMLLIFNFIEQEVINIQKQNRTSDELKHSVLVVEEGYNFVDKDFPIALNHMKDMAKRIRKYAGMLLFITQNIRDFTSTEEIAQKTMAIINNSQYHFVFSLASGDLKDLEKLYDGANALNDAELDLIAEASQGTCFFIGAAKQRTAFAVTANDVIQDIFLRDDERRV